MCIRDRIKRKCGIEVGKNYNLPKFEDSRQPMCPPEKEKAIQMCIRDRLGAVGRQGNGGQHVIRQAVGQLGDHICGCRGDQHQIRRVGQRNKKCLK